MVGDGAIPKKLGTFDILAKLADGGVGTIYLARRTGPKAFRRLVAIKRLHPHYASDASFVTMFTDEARLAARIHHANVVPVLELAADDDGYYVVMEYVEGSNLADLHFQAAKRDGKIPRAVAVRVILDALSGVHAAHEIEDDDGRIVNLVHRDISPQNILLGSDGLARVVDFGIARATQLRAFETLGASLKGKLEYMSPEQIECKPVDRTTDLFAMGIVLWEVVTGRRLFPAANQVTTIQRVCFDPIPSPRTIDAGISPEIEAVCTRALERDRSARFATAAAFAEALEDAARADVGIATQREVAAYMAEVLGGTNPKLRAAVREAAKSATPKEMPDLSRGPARGPFTEQLPPSDPMIKIAASSRRGGSKAAAPAATERHPIPNSDSIDTEPDGDVPSVRSSQDLANIAVTVQYAEGVPSEVIKEAERRSSGKK